MEEQNNDERYPKYKDVSLTINERVEDLVSRMTLAEKISQLSNAAGAIEHLDVPEYNWWNEALHGMGRAGTATVFPQAIGMAATFNEELIHGIACVISDEARAKHHEAVKHGDRSEYKGLTLWCPNINIFRDPRWGRGHETFGEDPYLTGRLGVAYVKGLQGDDEKYLKTVATPKHFAVHSGPEEGRAGFDSRVNTRDLWDTYLPHFKECIKEGRAASIMTAYNAINGIPCSANKYLIEDILRQQWGFEGYTVSDCGAVCNLHQYHKYTRTPQESSAVAIKNGLDLNCGNTFTALGTAVASELLTEEDINKAVKRLMSARFRLGMFDPEEMVPYSNIPFEIVDCEEHRALSLKAARESMVLLKNDNNVLPIKKEIFSIAVIGPNAYEMSVLLGNYNGLPSKCITPLEGIRNKVSRNTRVYYSKGCDLTNPAQNLFSEAIAMAERSEVVVMCLGLSPLIEGEAGDAYNSDAGGDKTHLNLPPVQQELLEAVTAVGKPVILVLISGSALAVNWAEENVNAVIQAWYPGQEAGNAIADVIFGDYNPSGKLPVTFYKTMEELPPFEDYHMEGRTYRFMKNEPLYPFGFGLSYTVFKYSQLTLSNRVLNAGESLEVSVDVENTGDCDGEEVVQLYLRDMEASTMVPKLKLQGFKKVSLKSNEKKKVFFVVTARQMAFINDGGKCILEPGVFKIMIGGCQPQNSKIEKYKFDIVEEEFEVKGAAKELEY